MKFHLDLLLLLLLMSIVSGARAATVAIDYVLESAAASIDPFTVPNPQGGADIVISPSITFESGSFKTQFLNADNAGSISDGEASIIGVEYSGALVIQLSSTIEVFGFPVPVSATLSGPIRAQQQTASTGTLAGLSLYAETSTGQYDVTAGPLDCSDSALGLFCAAIEAALGIEFPLAEVGGTSALPFAGGTFSDLNPASASAGSSVAAQIDFSFPLADGIEFGVETATNWVEVDRVTLVPEPSVAMLFLATLGLAGVRRR